LLHLIKNLPKLCFFTFLTLFLFNQQKRVPFWLYFSTRAYLLLSLKLTSTSLQKNVLFTVNWILAWLIFLSIFNNNRPFLGPLITDNATLTDSGWRWWWRSKTCNQSVLLCLLSLLFASVVLLILMRLSVYISNLKSDLNCSSQCLLKINWLQLLTVVKLIKTQVNACH